MSQEKRYFRLGLFVLIALGLFVGGVIIFGAGKLFEPRVAFETCVYESVDGLNVGADVKFQGVTLGQVTGIRLGGFEAKDPSNLKNRLELGKVIIVHFEAFQKNLPPLIAADPKTQVPLVVLHGLHVRMASGGITGPSFLEMIFLDPKETTDTPPPYTPKDLFIPSSPSFVVQLKSGIERLVDKLNDVKLPETVESANALLIDMRKAVNDLQVKSINENLTGAITDARNSLSRLKELLDSKEISNTLQNIEQTTAHAKNIISGPEVQGFVRDLPAISKDLKSAMARVDQILASPDLDKTLQGTASVGPALMDLRRVLRDLNNVVSSNKSEIDVMLTNLGRTSVNAAELTDDAKRNPARTFFGEAPPRDKSR